MLVVIKRGENNWGGFKVICFEAKEGGRGTDVGIN